MKTTAILGPRREIDWIPCLFDSEFQRWFQFGIRATTLIWQAGFFMRLLLRTKRNTISPVLVYDLSSMGFREYVFHFNLLYLFMNNCSIKTERRMKSALYL